RIRLTGFPATSTPLWNAKVKFPFFPWYTRCDPRSWPTNIDRGRRRLTAGTSVSAVGSPCLGSLLRIVVVVSALGRWWLFVTLRPIQPDRQAEQRHHHDDEHRTVTHDCRRLSSSTTGHR